MSGHSKWSTIKRAKEKTDNERGKVFTKIGREIAVAVKLGGPDPALNSKLSDVIAKAKANNMPSDTINRSIKKASGVNDNVNYEEIFYEGYGPAGSALYVKCLTDNKNRTAGEVRHIFDRRGAGLGTTNSVGYLFNRKGVIEVGADELNFDKVMEIALEAGAEDIESVDDAIIVYTDPSALNTVRDAIAREFEITSSGVEYVASMQMELDDENFEKFEGLVEALEDLDDVQAVYHNVK